ncbi:hypothetical protein VKT23_004972 [Stygiomarasmius scandens]|uniref:Glycoside hydrolase family 76 protein n=1 Tax=Marasmiellus scandens TaxID=2682957 RepID=A0ABR1JY93_9AGAR
MANTDNLIRDGIGVANNGSCQSTGNAIPYNTGLAMEGLALLVALEGNSSTEQFLFDTITSTSSVAWNDQNGIIVSTSGPTAEGHPQEGGDGHLIRGLVAAFQALNDQSLHEFVKQYLAVQYNAVLDLATSGNNSIYGSSWAGPPFSEFSSENQTLALSILVNGIALTNTELTSTTGTTQSPSGTETSSSTSDSHSNKAGVIAGGIIGGLSFIILTTLVMIYFWRRQHRSTSALEINQFDYMPPIFPIDPISGRGASKQKRKNQNQSTVSARITSGSQQYRTGGKSRQNEGGPPTDIPPVGEVLSQPANIYERAGARNQVREATLQSQARRRDLSIEELVRMLNERLQPGPHWETEGAMPPEYQNS